MRKWSLDITELRNNVNFFISSSVSAETSVKNDQFEEKNIIGRRYNNSGLVFQQFILKQLCNVVFFRIVQIDKVMFFKVLFLRNV
jgi:hypothetical protein